MNEQPTNPSPSLLPTVTLATSQGAREYQEDACGHWFDPGNHRLFAVVADGAGGHGGGAEAAQAAIAAAAAAWKPDVAGENPAKFLESWMTAAHLAVNEAAAKVHRSARAVIVACVTDGVTTHWVHAGDSRLLRFHEGKLVERTRDDSVVQVLFERGEISEDEMGTHPDQSRLLQSLGGEEPPSPRPGSAEVTAGDVLILCSDGFWEHLRQGELEKLAATPPSRRQHALDQAVAEAVRRAGPKADNTTAVMVHLDEAKAHAASAIAWLLLLLVLALIGFGAGWWLAKHRDAASQAVPEVTQQPSTPATAPPASSAPGNPVKREPIETPPVLTPRADPALSPTP